MTDRRRFASPTSRIGAGGVVLVAILISVVAVSALVAGFAAVRRMGAAARESRRLFAIQERADRLVPIQLDEETALRGYLISRRHVGALLRPYLSDPDPFVEQAERLERDLSGSDLGAAREHLEAMMRLHRAWRVNLALPLIERPSPEHAAMLAPYGARLDQSIRREAVVLRSEIDARNRGVEASLEGDIARIVDFAVGFVLIVALVVLFLALAQRSMYVAFARQREIARHLHAALDVGAQTIPASTVGSAYVSATVGSQVGGDVSYAWRLSQTRGAIMIADMSGKGIDAVVNTAFCKYSLRALLATREDPAWAMTQFNRLFADVVEDPSMFAVAFLGVLDAETGLLRYVSAGHESAFVRRGDAVRLLEIGGPIIGMARDSSYVASNLKLEPEDLVVLATDGVTESRNAAGQFLGIDGAVRFIAEAPCDPQSLCEQVVKSVRRRGADRLGDDIALLALRFEGVPAPLGGQTRQFAESRVV